MRLTAILTGLLLSTAAVSAEPITIYAGAQGGGYDAMAKQMAQRLEQRGFSATIENRAGSDDITLQACQNDRAVWIAQKDAIYVRETQDGCVLPVLGLYGDEVAVLLFPDGSRANELSDLDDQHSMLVDRVGSGSDLFWRTIRMIEQEHGRSDEWIGTRAVYGDPRLATALAARGDIHAVLLVRETDSDDFQRLLDAGWTVGTLKDKDIDDLKFGAQPLYETTKIEIKHDNRRAGRGRGYVVQSFIGTTTALEGDQDAFMTLLGALE